MATKYIPEDIISAVREAADIVDVVSETVMLKKTGANFVGLCPFHSEKTPSFTVSSQKQIFHCFGCGVGGNVFAFLMRQDGMTFPEAVHALARRYGIAIPTAAGAAGKDRPAGEREQIMAMNKMAMGFFHDTLRHSNQGKIARSYLISRGISEDTIRRFALGFAPDGWNQLFLFLTRKKVPLPLAEKAGLIVRKRQGHGYYDRFRNRVIFPILNTSRQVIGFGGRVMDDSLPKYLNSPETPVYNKGRSLYGAHWARAKSRDCGEVFVVEGYMDALMLAQNGVENVVATLGTALTPEHVRLLKGFANRVILVFDSDEAGLKAAQKSVWILNRDVEPRILVLPTGYDPDGYMSAHGPEAFRKAAEGAMGMIDFLMETAIKRYGLDVEGKVNIIRSMAGELAQVEEGIARSLYVAQLAERLGIDEKAVLEKVQAAVKEKQNSPHERRNAVDGRSPKMEASAQKSQEGRWRKMEEQIIAMMLQYPEALSAVRDKKILDLFESRALKSVGQLILSHEKDGAMRPAEIVQHIGDPSLMNRISSLAVTDQRWELAGCVGLMDQFLNSRRQRQDDLLQRIKMAEDSNDYQLLVRLLAEKQQKARKNK